MSKTQASTWQLFLIFLRLGLTSFGGPIAHLAYFREEFVTQRNWFTEQRYADLVALCQFLPGPASSQIGLSIGLAQGGYRGALAAWAGFTLPSAIVLVLFALSLGHIEATAMNGIIHGLKIVAVAVVAQAVWNMGKSLCPDRARITIMALTTALILLIPHPLFQLVIIVISGIIGLTLFKTEAITHNDSFTIDINKHIAKTSLVLFFILLFGLPLLIQSGSSPLALSLFDIFYRAGALVFGGGHVVLPLLQTELVPTGLINDDTFLAGYGAAQAVPGPLFTFAAFVGASLDTIPPWSGALIAISAIFLPSFLLVIGVLPYWQSVSKNKQMRAALLGINAAVVGLLLAALYNPVWTSAITSIEDFVLALLAFIALMHWKCPAWAIVLICGGVGWAVTVL
jgi:chromate transporter